MSTTTKDYSVIYPNQEAMMLEKIRDGFCQWDIIREYVYLHGNRYHVKPGQKHWCVRLQGLFEYDGRKWHRCQQ